MPGIIFKRAEGGVQPVKGWKIAQLNADGSVTTNEVDGSQHVLMMPSCRALMVNALFDTSGIRTMTATTPQSGIWYTLDGMRLKGRPQQSGVYIHSGHKVVVP